MMINFKARRPVVTENQLQNRSRPQLVRLQARCLKVMADPNMSVESRDICTKTLVLTNNLLRSK